MTKYHRLNLSRRVAIWWGVRKVNTEILAGIRWDLWPFRMTFYTGKGRSAYIALARPDGMTIR